MNSANRIFVIYGLNYNTPKMFFQTQNMAKGFIRLGHDVLSFNYERALLQSSMFKSKKLSEKFYKSRVDQLMAKQIRAYQPDIVYMSFFKAIDTESINFIREAAPTAILIGFDDDPWPKLQKNRVETACKLDILIATNDGQWLQQYREAGVPLCKFMPNSCDPAIEHRYEVGSEWVTDILWTGKTKHHADSSETLREDIVTKLRRKEDCKIYGCFGQPKIGGIDYYYAISGAKIGISVNAVNTVRLYHSDRLTHYLACGTCVLAKRIPDSDVLFKDGEHLKYFDEIDECFELSEWYLSHEIERKKLADTGMQRVHKEFDSKTIARYVLELIETGTYHAPWEQFCS